MNDMKKPIIIGAVHLPYYGRYNPLQSIKEIEEYVMLNVRTHYNNGIKTLYIQDENLNPGVADAETIALMASLTKLIKNEMPDIQLGIITQALDGKAAIAAATMAGADFVRIKVFAGSMYKAEGIRIGVGEEAVQYRTMINSNVKILADIHDREGMPMPGVSVSMTAEWASRIGADGLILTGHTYAETLEYIKEVKALDLGIPVLVGGSVNEKNIYEILDNCEGAVVSSSLMLDTPMEDSLLKWDAAKIEHFADMIEKYKESKE